jgi:hypothetical protein
MSTQARETLTIVLVTVLATVRITVLVTVLVIFFGRRFVALTVDFVLLAQALCGFL